MPTPVIRESHGPETARLYIRNDAPFVARDRVYEVEAKLQSTGVDVSIERWGRRIPWDGDDTARNRYERFQSWADDADVSLEPAFHRTSHTCQFTGESTEVFVPPVVTLAAYGTGDDPDGDGRLVAVYPHHDGSRYVSVEDAIEQLERARAARTA